MPCKLSFPPGVPYQCPPQPSIEISVNGQSVKVEFFEIRFMSASEFIETPGPMFKNFRIGCLYYQFFEIWRVSGFEQYTMNCWLIDDGIDEIRVMLGRMTEDELHIRKFMRMKSISNFFNDKRPTGISITSPNSKTETMIPEIFEIPFDHLPPHIIGIYISGTVKQNPL